MMRTFRLALPLALLVLASMSFADFSRPTENVWLGGPPSEADLDAMVEEGLGLVIDLRTSEEGIEETEQAARDRGLRYLNIAVGRELADEDLVAETGAALEQALADGERVLLHCASGNRAGEIWARHRVQQGISAERALAESRASGTRGERLEQLQEILAAE